MSIYFIVKVPQEMADEADLAEFSKEIVGEAPDGCSASYHKEEDLTPEDRAILDRMLQSCASE